MAGHYGMLTNVTILADEQRRSSTRGVNTAGHCRGYFTTKFTMRPGMLIVLTTVLPSS